MSQLSAEDRWDIHQALSYYGHVVDNAEWDKLDHIFAADVALESGLGTFHGLSGIQAFEQQSFLVEAPAHHVVNTIIRDGRRPGTAVAWSRFVLVTYGATALGGDYVDSFVRVDGQWRISARRVSERNRTRPDGAYSLDGAENFASWRTAS